jgi:hypothetical protein
MTSRMMIRFALLACAGLWSAGCASVQSSNLPDLERAKRQIEITNNNWATAAVYAVRGTARARIGTVETGRTALLRMPWNPVDEDVQLLIHLIGGGGDYLSPVMPRLPGRIAMSVENQLSLSSLTVR